MFVIIKINKEVFKLTISPFFMITNFLKKYLCNFAPSKYVLPLREILKGLLTPQKIILTFNLKQNFEHYNFNQKF